MTAHHHRRPWVRRARHVAFAVFLAVVAYLLVRAARAIDWSEVVAVLRGLDAATTSLQTMARAARTSR